MGASDSSAGQTRPHAGYVCSPVPACNNLAQTAENTDPVIRSLSSSSARSPASELPEAFSAGDHTQML